MSENNNLDIVAQTYECRNSNFLAIIKQLNINVMEKYMQEKSEGICLELGCGEGDSTKLLSKFFKSVVVCEGSEIFLNRAKNNLANLNNITYLYSLFEDIQDNSKYDFIAANYIFEHIENIEKVLDVCYSALKSGGYLFITVPNAKALSRSLAVEMGLLEDEYLLTENDLKHGHRRVFDMDSLLKEVKKTKFKVIEKGGLYVKPFADFQLKEMVEKNILNLSHFEGLQKLAKKNPEISGSIYICLQKV